VRYPFVCSTHGVFEIQRSIHEETPSVVPCPECEEESARVYEASPIVYKGNGFHSTGYFKESQGRGQPMDKLEWLNSNWSEKTGEAPPKPSGKVESSTGRKSYERKSS
jgi:predicted nucleic acid-binding Zn ribbon protein